MTGPLRDLLHAWRGLRQKPGFLVAALLTLAIGIGANITIFSLVNGLSLRPMPFGDRTDRLVTLHPTHPTQPQEDPSWGESEISLRDMIDFRTADTVQRVFDGLVRRGIITRPLTGFGLPHCLRISTGTMEQNRRCVEALEKVLRELVVH